MSNLNIFKYFIKLSFFLTITNNKCMYTSYYIIKNNLLSLYMLNKKLINNQSKNS